MEDLVLSRSSYSDSFINTLTIKYEDGIVMLLFLFTLFGEALKEEHQIEADTFFKWDLARQVTGAKSCKKLQLGPGEDLELICDEHGVKQLCYGGSYRDRDNDLSLNYLIPFLVDPEQLSLEWLQDASREWTTLKTTSAVSPVFGLC